LEKYKLLCRCTFRNSIVAGYMEKQGFSRLPVGTVEYWQYLDVVGGIFRMP
jgi:rhodanese-related sulfurtransferase